ncbi:MAG: hypothetical protein AB1505_29710 [Candidatus Latescibacterota bacterium]
MGVCLAWLAAGTAGASTYRIDTQRQWQEWQTPAGVVELGRDGSVRLVETGRREVNAVTTAGEFRHWSRDLKADVPGGIRNAGSSKAQADRCIDGHPDTWWQPAPRDGVDYWWVEVDLGRAVLARQVRLTFPDTAGARPFRFFSVFVSEGVQAVQAATTDFFSYRRVGTTIKPNAARTVAYDLHTYNPSRSTGEYLVTADTVDFAPVQYVRFVAEGFSEDAALAEIEVEGQRENLALGTLARGGSLRSGTPAQAPFLIDGSMDKPWTTGSGNYWMDWRRMGKWFAWDLGATFFVDQFVLLTTGHRDDPGALPIFFENESQLYGYVVYTSDGTKAPVPEPEKGDLQYDVLSSVDNREAPLRWAFNHVFPRRRARYLFGHTEHTYGYAFIYELFLYATGYPAQVQLESGFIDMGNSKTITALDWEADTPPGSRIVLWSRSGQTLTKEVRYFLKTGVEVSETKWRSLPPIARGRVEETVIPSSDWSTWSPPYRQSGEVFLSPTPRRYLQLRVALETDDPQDIMC